MPRLDLCAFAWSWRGAPHLCQPPAQLGWVVMDACAGGDKCNEPRVSHPRERRSPLTAGEVSQEPAELGVPQSRLAAGTTGLGEGFASVSPPGMQPAPGGLSVDPKVACDFRRA